MHGEVDEEVGRAGEGESEVAEVGDVRHPSWPRNCRWTVVLKINSYSKYKNLSLSLVYKLSIAVGCRIR